MNIVITTFTYWPNNDGVQMVTEYMAEGFAKKGHQVTVLTYENQNCNSKEVHNEVKIKRFLVKSKVASTIVCGAKKQFQKYLLDHQKETDVLISICANTVFTVWTYQIIDKLSCKKIMYQHGMYDGKFHFERCNSFIRFIKMLFLTPYWEMFHRKYWPQIMKYDACIHLFERDSSYNYFKKHGFQNSYVINNSCEAVFFEEQYDNQIEYKYNCFTKPYFIYVANYCKRKDQALAIKTFFETKATNAELVLIGSKENEYVQRLRCLTEELKKQYPTHGDVHILTDIPRKDTVELIKGSYACLLTSNNEYLPITIIEAMAAGKPFISMNVGVVSKLPGGVICHNREEIVYWMDYFLEHPKVVRKMGNIAKCYANENMYLDDKVNQLEKIVKKI